MIWVRGLTGWVVYFHFLRFGYREALGDEQGKRNSAVVNLIGGNPVWTCALNVGAMSQEPTGRKSWPRRLSSKSLQMRSRHRTLFLPKFEKVGGTQRSGVGSAWPLDFTLRGAYFGPHAACSAAACSMQGDNDETDYLKQMEGVEAPKCRD